jgi:hypothetical protein
MFSFMQIPAGQRLIFPSALKQDYALRELESQEVQRPPVRGRQTKPIWQRGLSRVETICDLALLAVHLPDVATISA